MRRVSPTRGRRLRFLAGALAALAALGAGAFALLWAAGPDPTPLAKANPRTTALIEQRKAEASARRRPWVARQVWVPIDRVAPRLVEAVLLSEDAGFWGHEGIDWDATWDAARVDWKSRRFARGASTLTQQLAKNLWLGTEKSLLRKAKEAVLAVKLERRLSKRRILALYLNVAEWGEGVFGLEAGTRARFGISAAVVSTAQAVVMASILPAPRRVDLASPTTWLKRRARRLLDRMAKAHRISDEEHLHARAELERILAGPAPADDREEAPAEDEEASPEVLPDRSAPPQARPHEPSSEPEPEPRPQPHRAPNHSNIRASPSATPTSARQGPRSGDGDHRLRRCASASSA